MAAEGHGPTAGEYIVHHLTHLQNWSLKPVTQKAVVDFTVFNFDSLFCSLLLGVLGCFLLWLAARKATSGVPGRFQAAVEILVEMVDTQAKGIVHNAKSRKFVAPLALTVFVWIFLMNAMDLLPVDLLPAALGQDLRRRRPRPAPRLPARRAHRRPVDHAWACRSSVLLICLFYNIKIKGLGGWVHELFTAPFGNHPVL